MNVMRFKQMLIANSALVEHLCRAVRVLEGQVRGREAARRLRRVA